MNDLCTSLLETMETPALKAGEVRMLNPLALAYIGDGVHELLVRTYVISKYKGSIHNQNQRVVKMIKATAQSAALRQMEHLLTEEEMTIVKRGRNAKSLTVPKNTPVGEYRLATGFEALLGYLFLNDEKARLTQIVAEAIRLSELTETSKTGHNEQPYE